MAEVFSEGILTKPQKFFPIYFEIIPPIDLDILS